MEYIKVCKICGKEFKANRKDQEICKDEHYANCSICGKPTKLTTRKLRDYLKGNMITCSTECAKQKSKITCMNRYGRSTTFDIEKSKQTKLKRYGSETYNNRDKASNTVLEKYGVNNVSKAEDIKNKIKDTMIKNHGVSCTFEIDGFTKQSAEVKKKRYGEHYELIGKKISNTWNNKSEEEKLDIINRIKDIKVKKYGYSYYNLKEASKTMNRKYGVPYYCMTDDCKNANGYIISKINKEFSKLLSDNNINNTLEFKIQNMSYDIKVEPNILIEINPTYTHNSTYGPIFNNHNLEPKDKNYHLNKSNLATDNGYHCIHIFDWDNWDKIINMLLPKSFIYERKCDIKEVSKEECSSFENKYHLQGYCNSQQVMLGLYYNNELVELMTFGKPRYNKNYEWELLRLCSHKDYKIIGGAEKLFIYFIRNYNPKSIISYCDYSKFSGDVYNRLGFKKMKNSTPSKHWYNGKQHITDNLLRQRGYDQLFNTHYGKGTSNEQLMLENGFVEIYDCGQMTFIWSSD